MHSSGGHLELNMGEVKFQTPTLCRTIWDQVWGFHEAGMEGLESLRMDRVRWNVQLD